MTNRATAEGTSRYRERFQATLAGGHFRRALDDGPGSGEPLWLSSIGLGTYLGHHDSATDESYCASAIRAAELGCNVFDTAANYRFQRSERSLGDAIAALARDELVVCTKGGYVPFDGEPPRSQQEMIDYLDRVFIRTGICQWSDFVRRSHCMTPRYLSHQLEQSLKNLRLETVDVYYIHNPESQLSDVPPEEFYRRLARAFELLETMASAGKLACYGTATWNGFRVESGNPEYLSLEGVSETARAVAGDANRFKAIQLPINLSMIEAATLKNQTVRGRPMTLLQAAEELGVTVFASASILQARLAAGKALEGVSSQLRTNAQRAIQFVRDIPGVTTALVGMARVEHVEENMEVARIDAAAAGG
jgi:aryl-alcohol dehydrogenase-like predicted oxidoreductase